MYFGEVQKRGVRPGRERIRSISDRQRQTKFHLFPCEEQKRSPDPFSKGH
jgi:hypothetical protein